MKDLEDFAKAQLLPAQAIVQAGRELTPMLVFENHEGTGVGAVPDYGNPEAKVPLRHMMRALLKEKDATRYAVIMEAWMGTGKGTTIPQGYRPSEDPQRREAIVITAADITGQHCTVVAFIKRDGGISFDKPEVITVDSGPLTELLTTPTRH